jgi:hypothetical protein
MNNDDIYMNLMNYLDDMIYVDHVLQMMLIYMDNRHNKTFLIFLIVFQ